MSMLKTISFIIITAILSTVLSVTAFAATEIYMDKNSAGYVEEKGLFFDDSVTKDASGKTTRNSFSRNAKLSYNLNITNSGNYIVYYWNTGSQSNRNQQEFIINSDDGESTVRLNLKGNEGWKYLGVYKFSANAGGKVSLLREITGGAIRSGRLKLVKTDKPTAVAYSQDPVKPVRNYLPGNGIHVINSIPSDKYIYEEVSGSFGDIGAVNCTGRAAKYSDSVGAKVRYRPNIERSGEYHVLFYSMQNGTYTPTALSAVVSSSDKVTNFSIDCQKHNGWVYLGKYKFGAGTNGYLETTNNEEGKRLFTGGAYFVSVDDPDFDSSLYATVESAGTKIGAKPLENGEYVISTGGVGYCETGREDLFHTAGDLLDCEGRYSRYFSGEGSEKNSITYNAAIQETGEYEVFYYVIKNSSNSYSQTIEVISNGGSKTDTKYVNCRNNDGWVSLGKYQFTEGTLGTVILHSMRSSFLAKGTTRSGGVKFVKK